MQQLNLTTTLLNHENDYNESKCSDTSSHEHTTSSGEGSFAKVIEKQLNKEIKNSEDMQTEQYDGSADAKEDFEENSVALLKTNQAKDTDNTDEVTDKATDKTSSETSTEVNNETALQGTHASNEQKIADSGKIYTATGNDIDNVNTKSENSKQPEKLISYLESANKVLLNSEAEDPVKGVNKKIDETTTEQDNRYLSGKRKDIKEQLITASGKKGEHDEALQVEVKNTSNNKIIEVENSASNAIKPSTSSDGVNPLTSLSHQKLDQTDTGSLSPKDTMPLKDIMPLKDNLIDKPEQAKINQEGFSAKSELGVKGGNQNEEAVTRLASQQVVNKDESSNSNSNEFKKDAGNQGKNTVPIQSVLSESHALDLKAKSLESKNLETINFKASETLSAEFAKATHKKMDSQLDTSSASTKVSESTINPTNKIDLLVTNSNTSRGNADSFATFNKTKLNEATDFALNHNLSNMSQSVNDIAAPQKNSGQIHQETISVLRQDFAQAVKDKVMVIISQKLQQFDITLDPPELGNMHVRVNLQGEQAVVNFTVNSAQTKDVLEAHMNKLKDMLSEQGVNLGDTDVNQGNDPQHNNEQGEFTHNAGANNQAHDIAEQITFSPEQFNQAISGIDYYA